MNDCISVIQLFSYSKNIFMKRKVNTWLCLALLLALYTFQQTMAVPAYPHPVQYRQPDGSVVTLLLKGDEYIHWATSPEGYTLLINKAGFYEYAKTDPSGNLALSGVRYHNSEEQTPEEKDLQKTILKNLRYSGEQKSLQRQAWQIREKESLRASGQNRKELVGTVRIPLILVGFPGKTFSKSKESFEMLVNQPNYTENGTITGSVCDYFYDNSYGQLTFQADVYGPYTLSRSIANYNYLTGGDSRIMAIEAAQLAHDNGCDFSRYDKDGDGVVDGIHIIFAGYGVEAGASINESIWSHSSRLGDEYELFLDGARIDWYLCTPELRGNAGSDITHIGVIAHELSHVFGLPDFYDADYDWNGQSIDTGEWDLMAHGSWNDNGRTPANHNAWSKDYLGWVPAVELTSETNHITLPNPAEEGAIYKINTTTPNEYFLLENHQRQHWDAYIPSSGLLIYHVDENFSGWEENCVNCVASHRGLYLKQAGGGINSNSSNRVSDPYPYAGNNRLTNNSIPNSRSWAGANTNAPVTQITHDASNHSVSFLYMENPDYYDAQLTRFVDLPASCYYTGEMDIQIEMVNNGRAITSATINWSIDGITQTAYQWTGSLLYDNSQIVTIGTVDLSIGAHIISATIVVTDDTDDTNDTISTTIEIKPLKTLPYSTEFDGSLDGWESVDIAGGIHWEWSNNQYFYNYSWEIQTSTWENGYALYNLFQNDTYPEMVQGALLSPVFDFSGVEDAIDLSFDHTAMPYYWNVTTLKVQASTDNFRSQIVDVWSFVFNEIRYLAPEVITTDLSAFAGESNVQIRFLYDGGIAYGWAIDDIKIAVDKEPRLKSLTVSEGQLSPEFNPVLTNYTVKVPNEIRSISIESIPVRASDRVTGAGIHSLVEGNNIFPITVSNADNSVQKVYTVTVKRQGAVLRIPFTEDFETGAPAWTQENENQANQWHIGTATAASGQYSAYISSDGGLTNSYTDIYSRSYLYCDVYFTPHPHSETNIYELSFDWKGAGEGCCDYLNIFLIDTDREPVAGEYLYPYLFSYQLYQQSHDWQKITINLSDYGCDQYQDEVKRLVFMWINDSSVNGYPPVAIDNVCIWSVAPDEAKLENLTVSAGRLSPEFSQEIFDYTVNVHNEMDSITLDASAIRAEDTVIGIGTKHLEEGNNLFEIVVSNPEGNIQRIYTVTVKRLGAALIVPFTEDFETGASGWTQVNGNQVNQWHIGTATAASGQYSAYISSDGGLTNSYTDDYSISYLYCDVYFTPSPNPETNIYELSFDWKGFGEGCCDYLNILLIDTDIEPVAGEYLYPYLFFYQLYQQSPDWKKMTINMSEYAYYLYSGDVKRLVFMWVNDSSVNDQPPIAIDKVSIRSVDITEAKLANIMVSSGELSPSFSSETFDYTVAVRNEVNSVTLNASPLRSIDTVSGTGVKSLEEGNNPFEIAVSNPEGTVQNTYTVKVNRLPPLFEVPFTETFEEANHYWIFANEGQTNQWHIGTATAASDTHSVYISNDGGVTNSYSLTPSISYMSCIIYLNPGDDFYGRYHLNFDWKGEGNVHLYLTDVNAEPIAGKWPWEISGYYNIFGGLAGHASTWQNYSAYFWDYSRGIKRLVFAWYNYDYYYYTDAQPPVAIDHLSLDYSSPNDASLRSLTVNHGSISPAFSPKQFSYTVNVDKNVDEMLIEAVPTNLYATVIGANQTFTLNTGSNTFNILVIAEDISYWNTYTVKVNRGTSSIDHPATETLNVYPNPTQGLVYVENAVGQEIRLYDTLGNLLEQTLGNHIDLAAYPKGMYLLRVAGSTVKVVKQ